MTLETGIRGEQSVLVTAANTAKTMGSGTLDVFATPALVARPEHQGRRVPVPRPQPSDPVIVKMFVKAPVLLAWEPF